MSKNFRGEDITGKVFGNLTVLKFYQNQKARSYWLCRCVCGNNTVVRVDHLKKSTVSCGCKRSATIDNSKKYFKYIGKKFGKLTIRNIFKDNGIYKCSVICECGNIKNINLFNVISNKQYSCGCDTSSAGERIIEKELLKFNVCYIKQKSFYELKNKRKLYFDFYLPEYNCAIEFDGKQHFENNTSRLFSKNFEKTRIRDILKNNFCFNNKIYIIRIPYFLIEDICIDQLIPYTTWFLINNNKDYDEYIHLENNYKSIT